MPSDVFEELTKDLEDNRLRFFFVAISTWYHTTIYSSTPVHTDESNYSKRYNTQYVWVNYDIHKVTEETLSLVDEVVIQMHYDCYQLQGDNDYDPKEAFEDMVD